MKQVKSLRVRIVRAYIAFALTFCALFAVFAAITVESIEVRLVDERLQAVAAWASPRHAGGLPVEMPAGLSFYHAPSIPVSLRGLPAGVHELGIDGRTLQVFAGRDASGEFVVVDHNTDYEHIEEVVYSLLAFVLLGFLLLSAVFGSFVARGFVDPITRLARLVREGGDDPVLARRTDELGQLSQAFAERTGALHQVLERERSFTGDVSHELRTPLTVIMGASEVLLSREERDSLVASPAQRIYSAAKEASDVVTTLLLLARAGAAGERSPVDMNEVAAAEVARYQSLVEGKPVSLRLEQCAHASVNAQRELCSVAVGNLIRNACQYTASGEVVVTVHPDRIEVRDTGPGLPDSAVATLEGRPGAGSAGTGLGLSLARRVCDALGFSLSYSRPASGGSLFTVNFGRP